MSPLIDPLPDDVRVWLDSHSTGSVVYITLGSVAFITHQVARPRAIVQGQRHRVIVLPIFGDQSGNAARVMHHGFGFRLEDIKTSQAL